MHESEAKRIHELAKGDPQKEARLTAAACALVRCADGVPQDDPAYAKLKGLQDAGEGMPTEKALLSDQMGRDGRIYGPLFQYTIGQKFQDSLNQNRVAVRVEGMVQTGLSMAGLASDGVACTTGIGCVGAAVTGTVLADNLVAGTVKMVSGKPTVTYGEQVLQSLGMTPQGAAIAYAIAGVAPVAVEAVVLNKAVNAQTVARLEARKTYEPSGSAVGESNTGILKFGNVPESISTSSGIPIRPAPGTTTTVLGGYANDMDNIINSQLNYPKTTDFGPKPGGFNVLNVPDEMYKTPDQFWNEVNKPFLDVAIRRGDAIILATKPTADLLYRDDGTLTGFGREIQHLTQNGYHYNAVTGKMVPN